MSSATICTSREYIKRHSHPELPFTFFLLQYAEADDASFLLRVFSLEGREGRREGGKGTATIGSFYNTSVLFNIDQWWQSSTGVLRSQAKHFLPCNYRLSTYLTGSNTMANDDPSERGWGRSKLLGNLCTKLSGYLVQVQYKLLEVWLTYIECI